MNHEELTQQLLARIPKEQRDAVFGQEFCDIDPGFVGFIGVYEALSRIIPKHFAVVDLGCAYNAQCYYFADHKKYYAVDMSTRARFHTPNCALYLMPIAEFIKEHLCELDLDETFAICSFVPPWLDDNRALVQSAFKNVFTFYPHDRAEAARIGRIMMEGAKQ